MTSGRIPPSPCSPTGSAGGTRGGEGPRPRGRRWLVNPHCTTRSPTRRSVALSDLRPQIYKGSLASSVKTVTTLRTAAEQPFAHTVTRIYLGTSISSAHAADITRVREEFFLRRRRRQDGVGCSPDGVPGPTPLCTGRGLVLSYPGQAPSFRRRVTPRP